MKVRTHHNHDPSGAITPKTRWRLYAGNPLAPLRRKQIGSYTPEIDTYRSDEDLDTIMYELLGNIASEADDRNCFSESDACLEGSDRQW